MMKCFNVSRFWVIQKKPQGGRGENIPPPNRDRVNNVTVNQDVHSITQKSNSILHITPVNRVVF